MLKIALKEGSEHANGRQALSAGIRILKAKLVYTGMLLNTFPLVQIQEFFVPLHVILLLTAGKQLGARILSLTEAWH